MDKVKRWCGRCAAGTETAALNPMVEAHGDPDEDTHYVLASDYDALLLRFSNSAQELAELKAEVAGGAHDSATYPHLCSWCKTEHRGYSINDCPAPPHEPSAPYAEELTDAARWLVKQLDECEPHITSAFHMAYNVRGGSYSGPQYGKALDALRAALAKNPASVAEGSLPADSAHGPSHAAGAGPNAPLTANIRDLLCDVRDCLFDGDWARIAERHLVARIEDVLRTNDARVVNVLPVEDELRAEIDRLYREEIPGLVQTEAATRKYMEQFLDVLDDAECFVDWYVRNAVTTGATPHVKGLRERLTKAVTKMREGMPPKMNVPDPNCAKCSGSGYRPGPWPQTHVCECVPPEEKSNG